MLIYYFDNKKRIHLLSNQIQSKLRLKPTLLPYSNLGLSIKFLPFHQMICLIGTFKRIFTSYMHIPFPATVRLQLPLLSRWPYMPCSYWSEITCMHNGQLQEDEKTQDMILLHTGLVMKRRKSEYMMGACTLDVSASQLPQKSIYQFSWRRLQVIQQENMVFALIN